MVPSPQLLLAVLVTHYYSYSKFISSFAVTSFVRKSPTQNRLSTCHHSQHTTVNPIHLLSCRAEKHQSAEGTGMFWPEQQQQDNRKVAEGEEEEEEEEDELSKVLDSILKIHCTHSEPDYLIPWQKRHQSTSTSSGFPISVPGMGKRVMTNAHSVDYGSIIQVQRRGEERKYEAEVDTIANECDLALLKVESPVFWEDLDPLGFGPLPTLQDEVEVLGYPTGGESLSITQGVVSRIEMQEYTQASAHLLAIQIDAAINPGNSGGPVVNKDLQVIGVAFQGLEGAENIGYVVPVTVVQHVMHDIERNGKYTGFCSLGVALSNLESKAFRKLLGMLDKNISGIMVKELAPTAASKDILRPYDVIVKVDGIPVANDGKIPFRPGERVAVACYIQTKFLGDKVSLNVLREGEELELDVPVGITRPLVPTHWTNRPPPYYVVAGLVFTALSTPYLHAKDAWDYFISDNISYLVGKTHQPLERETDEVVILAQVLAHRENLGYDKLTDLHLVKVNGQEVRSLKHLKQILDNCQDTFLRFEFSPKTCIVVIERSSVESVTQEVCEEHSVRRPFLIHKSHAHVKVEMNDKLTEP